MNAADWVEAPLDSLLDIGCNVGAWLCDCLSRYPNARIAGVDINESSLDRAKRLLPSADIRYASAEDLPFANESFHVVTCLEVLEHLPPDLRSKAFNEVHRVLRPGGRFIISVPHAGWFSWLDSNNMRFRLPVLYRWLIRRGRRDEPYEKLSRRVEWHHHFTTDELDSLAGNGWKRVSVVRGGLFVFPIMDWLSWPFYRLGASAHPIRRAFERVGSWDYGIDYGNASYGVLVVLDKEA